MVPDLVSIITPCYNTASYLPVLLQSVLNQTYSKIEMFIIDDGSPDNIKCVFDQFLPKFERKGYSLSYIRQENSGQSAAIQKGLDAINGEFLVWPDSDDFYASQHAIEKMVKRFKECDASIGMVRTQEAIVSDDEQHSIIKILGTGAKTTEDKSLFLDCLLQKNCYYFCAGGYMVRVSALKKSSRFPIFISKDAGQNWQLMLPVLYHYGCSTILEPLYNVVERTTSHSRVQKNYEQARKRINTYRVTILETLNNILGITSVDKVRYSEAVENKYRVMFFQNAVNYYNREESKKYYFSLKKHDQVTTKIRIKYLLTELGLLKAARNIKAALHL